MHGCVYVCVCTWVQGWITHSKHIKAFPFALHLPNIELEPTQSALSLVSLCLFLQLQPILYTKKKKQKETKLSLADGDRGLYADNICLRFRSSGICGAWTWTRRWRLSTPCRRGPWRSRSAGRFPSRESLSSSAWCTPHPASAPVCRFWSRNDGRSSSPLSSQMIAGRGHPHALRGEDKKH